MKKLNNNNSKENIVRLISDAKLQTPNMSYWFINNYLFNIRTCLDSKFQQGVVDFNTKNDSYMFLGFLYNKIVEAIENIFTESELQREYDEYRNQSQKTEDEQFLIMLKSKQQYFQFLNPMEKRFLELLEKEKK